jgi:hypothetical protein
MPASVFTQEIADEICLLIGQGRSLVEICRAEGMPEISTVFGWLGKKPDFEAQYRRAREAQADLMAEEILLISDEAQNDYVERLGRNGGTFTALDTEAVLRSKLRVDTRKWLMAKLQPKKYGERVAVEHSGDVGFAERLIKARERVKKAESEPRQRS